MYLITITLDFLDTVSQLCKCVRSTAPQWAAFLASNVSLYCDQDPEPKDAKSANVTDPFSQMKYWHFRESHHLLGTDVWCRTLWSTFVSDTKCIQMLLLIVVKSPLLIGEFLVGGVIPSVSLPSLFHLNQPWFSLIDRFAPNTSIPKTCQTSSLAVAICP